MHFPYLVFILLISSFGLLTACSDGSSTAHRAAPIANNHSINGSGLNPPVQQAAITREQNRSYIIENADDDAQENAFDGSVVLDDKSLTLGSHNNALLGLRFRDIKIPKGSVVTSAYLQFSAHGKNNSTQDNNLSIAIEDSDNSAPFSSSNENISSRKRLANEVSWRIQSAWDKVNENGEQQRSPNLTVLLQQIVNKSSWRSGNAVSFILTGDNVRYAHSYESSLKTLEVKDLAPTLVVKLANFQAFKPRSSNDDAEENLTTHKVITNGSDLELGWESEDKNSAQLVGIRFPNINITPKSKIHRAYIQFTQDEAKNANPFKVTLYAEKTDNALPFDNDDNNLSERILSKSKVLWQSDKKWVVLKESGKLQRTPDLSLMLQELVDNPKWQLGNAVSFLIKGTGTRTAEPFESGPDAAPKLVVEYTNASSLNSIDKIRLAWRDDPSSTISIIWNQKESSQATVYYDEYQADKCPSDPRQYKSLQTPQLNNRDYAMHTYKARLTNLKADTAYRFIIKNEHGTSQCSWFRTAPNRPKAFSYISGGDTKSSGSALEVGRWSNQMVAKVRPLFVLFTGDFNSGLGLNSQRWQQWLDDWSTLTRSQDGRVYPIIAVHGNHENGDFEVLYKLFDIGNSNIYEKQNIAYNGYSFGGNLLYLVSLNSELATMLRSKQDKEQSRWLKDTLAQDFVQAHTFKVAGYHKPMRPHTSSKSEGTHLVQAWAKIFEQYKIQVAYESDTHIHSFTYPIRLAHEGEAGDEGFIRDDKRGIMHVGEGSWGASPRDANDNKSWTINSGRFNQIKLNRVYPAINNQPARLDISVIKIAEKNHEDKTINYVSGVKERKQSEPMGLPAGITLHTTPNIGKTISIPFNAPTP